MAINTGLSVPVFNIIKYFVLFVSLDIIARLSLQSLHSFTRGYRLARGHSVPLSSNPVDRYGLTSTSLKSVSFLQGFIVFLILGIYATEVMLEFSSDSVPVMKNVPGEMLLLPPDVRTCGIASLGVTERIINFASECVVLDEKTNNYKMYKANWQVTNASILPNCPKTNANMLATGPLMYSDFDWIYDQPTGVRDDIQDFDHGVDSSQGLFTINVSSEDVYLTTEITWSENHLGGIYRTVLPNSRGICHGTIAGRKGENITKVENRSCTRSSSGPKSDATDIIFISASGVAYTDINKLKSAPWNISVIAKSFHGVHGIRNFSQAIRNREAFASHAFLMFLGVTHNRDRRSLQQYAIAYKNCDLVQVPSLSAEPKLEIVPNARSELVVNAEIQEWALIAVASWLLFLIIIRVALSIAIRRQSLPRCVQGEADIARLWHSDVTRGHTSYDMESAADHYCESDTTSTTATDSSEMTDASPQKRRWWNFFSKAVQVQFYLSAKEGSGSDDITVTKSPKIG